MKKFLREKNFNYILIAVGVIFVIAELHRVSDFKIFLLASEALAEGENIYTQRYIDGFRYYYSPLFAILLRPLTYLPDYLAASLWSLLSLGLFIRTISLIRSLFLPNLDETGKLNLIVIISGITVIYASFHNNQMSAFMLWAIFEAYNLIFRKSKWILGAAILALAINIKLLPIVIIPYLLYRTEYKAAAATVVFIAAYLIFPSTVLGWETNSELLASYWSTINPSASQNILDIEEPGLLSISSLLSTLLSDQFSINELGMRRHIIVLSESSISVIINLSRLLFVALTLFFLKWPPFKKAISREQSFWELSYLTLIIPIIFPHQQNYGFFLIFPALYYLIYKLWFSPNIPGLFLKVLFVFAVILINLELLIGPYKMHFWNYKILTYGALLLVFLLTQVRPKLNSD